MKKETSRWLNVLFCWLASTSVFSTWADDTNTVVSAQQLASERQLVQKWMQATNNTPQMQASLRALLDWNARGLTIDAFRQAHNLPAVAPTPQQLSAERQLLQKWLQSTNNTPQMQASLRAMLDWNARGLTIDAFRQAHNLPAVAPQSAASAAGATIFGGHNNLISQPLKPQAVIEGAHDRLVDDRSFIKQPTPPTSANGRIAEVQNIQEMPPPSLVKPRTTSIVAIESEKEGGMQKQFTPANQNSYPITGGHIPPPTATAAKGKATEVIYDATDWGASAHLQPQNLKTIAQISAGEEHRSAIPTPAKGNVAEVIYDANNWTPAVSSQAQTLKVSQVVKDTEQQRVQQPKVAAVWEAEGSSVNRNTTAGKKVYTGPPLNQSVFDANRDVGLELAVQQREEDLQKKLGRALTSDEMMRLYKEVEQSRASMASTAPPVGILGHTETALIPAPNLAEPAVDSQRARGTLTPAPGANLGTVYGEGPNAPSRSIGGKGTAVGAALGTIYGEGPGAQPREIGGKGEFYRQKFNQTTDAKGQRVQALMEGAQDQIKTPLTPTHQAINNQDQLVNRIGAPLTPKPQAINNQEVRDQFVNRIGAPMTPIQQAINNDQVKDQMVNRIGAPLTPATPPPPAAMVPGATYHTPPPGYRGSDVIQNQVPNRVAVHTPPPTRSVTDVAMVRPTRPTTDVIVTRTNSSQMIMIDAFCPKHHIKYGGQVRPGETIECPLCKKEKIGDSNVAKPPVRPSGNTSSVNSSAGQFAMIDAFCPKHHIKYGGQVRPGQTIECPMCKAEKSQVASTSKPATTTMAPGTSVHTPPPNPSVPNKPNNNQLPNYGPNFIR